MTNYSRNLKHLLTAGTSLADLVGLLERRARKCRTRKRQDSATEAGSAPTIVVTGSRIGPPTQPGLSPVPVQSVTGCRTAERVSPI